MRIRFCAILLVTTALTSCVDSINQSDVTPKAGVPDAIAVEELRIPKDETLPTYALIVEPVRVRSSVSTRLTDVGINFHAPKIVPNASGTISSATAVFTDSLSSEAVRIKAQLTTALSGVDNFKVYTTNTIQCVKNGIYCVKIGSKEHGPYVVQAQLTEFNENVTADDEKVSALVYKSRDNIREGIVTIDVQVIDGKTGTIVTAFSKQGTFRQKTKKRSFTVYERSQTVQSFYQQAMRVALNESAKEIYTRLAQK